LTEGDGNHSTIEPRRSPSRYVSFTFFGFLIGSANVIPGVSGGTMALILGIYEELIQSIRMIGRPEFLRPLFRFRIVEALEVIHFRFLTAVGLGGLLAIFSLARLLEWLLVTQPVFVWSFFFGLILASVWVVVKRLERWNWAALVALAVGTAGAYLLVGLVPVQTPSTWWAFLLSGALAIGATILPGVSGALVLLIIGKYQDVIAAVNDRDVMIILLVGIGAAIGLLTVAQVLGWLFRRFHDLTLALLIGLMVGSLRKIWPWKIDLEWIDGPQGERIPLLQENVLPELTTATGFNHEVLLALIFALAGLGAVVLLEHWGDLEVDSEHTG
jgi:putative membrane protein